MGKMDKQARQGDIFFKKIEEFPEGLKKRRSKVFAEGEMTGHHHEVTKADLNKCDVFVNEAGELYFEAKEELRVTHPEHNPLTDDPTHGLKADPLIVKPGKYKVVRQIEYMPTGNRIVAD